MDKAQRELNRAQQWGDDAQHWGNETAQQWGNELNGNYEIVKDRYGLQAATHPSSQGYTCLLYLMAIIFPPVPVFLKCGCGIQILINIFLCALSWFPGIIHAIFIIIAIP